MTTIAYKDGVLAADTQSQDAHGLRFSSSKAKRGVRDGLFWLFGSSGSKVIGLRLFDAICEVLRAPELFPSRLTAEDLDRLLLQVDPSVAIDRDDENMALLAVKCGQFAVRVYQKQKQGFIPVTIRPYHAVGSGRDFALAAMHMGRGAMEAVEVARIFDVGTGGEIQTVEF